MREAVRVLMLIAVVVCLCCFLIPIPSKTKTETGGELQRLTLGLAFSPWYTNTVLEERGEKHERTNVTLWSWSWMLLVAAGLLVGIRDALAPPEASKLDIPEPAP